MTDINLNQNTVAECLKSTTNWGSTTYQNVCSGTSSTVVWGPLDYLGYSALTAVMLAFAALVVGVVVFFGVVAVKHVIDPYH